MDNENDKMLVSAILELTKEIKELRAEMKTPDIRVVTQKPIAEPKTPFEETLTFTTRQVNEHLNSMNLKDADKIIRQALGVTPSDAGPGSPMTQYLNDNYGTIMSVADVNEAMVESIANARKKWTVSDRRKSLEYVDKQLKPMQ